MKLLIHTIVLICLCSITAPGQTIPNWVWAKSAGDNGDEEGKSIALDAAGNVYVTGFFTSSTITFGTTLLTNAGNEDMYIVKYDASGNVVWAKSAGGNLAEQPKSITVDGAGNSYITGFYTSTTFTLGTTTLTKAGDADFFIVKYDAMGNVVWAKGAGGLTGDFGYDITNDGAGNIYVTGAYQSATISFGTATLTNTVNNSSRLDIFIVKYNASGNVIWAKGAGGTQNDYAVAISLDAAGKEVYVTGTFQSPSITIGATTLTNVNSAFQHDDIFIAKYDSSGATVWAKSAGGNNYDYAYDIATDASGNSFITGNYFSPTLAFGTTILTNTDNTSNSTDLFLAKYDVGGTLVWVKNIGGSNTDAGYGLATDAAGNIYLTGYFFSTIIVFGTITLPNLGSADFYITKFDPSGNTLWSKSAGGTDSEIGMSVVVDAQENVYVAGAFFSNTLVIGTTTLTRAGGGSRDVFVTKLGKPAGIEPKELSAAALDVFPNPSNGTINISCINTINKIEITNTLGQIIYSSSLNQKEISLRLEDEGIYFVSITSGEGRVMRKVVISGQ